MEFPFPMPRLKEGPMRVLVPGAGGMVGREVVRELARKGHEAAAVTHSEFDLSDPMSIANLIAGGFGQIDAVINCAAYTAVDRAESEEQEATDANGLGVAYLGQACMQIGAALIHLSTDFVFDGEAEEPYTEDAATNPLSAYGRSKLHGEEALAGNPMARVVRTSWLFAPEGRCFPRTMVDAFRSGKSLRVVADQRGNPTYVPDLVRALVEMLEKDVAPGVYHVVGPETTNWHDFAVRAIRAVTGETPEIAAVTTAEYPTPAVRPKMSALRDTKLGAYGIGPLRSLDDALEDWAARAY